MGGCRERVAHSMNACWQALALGHPRGRYIDLEGEGGDDRILVTKAEAFRLNGSSSWQPCPANSLAPGSCVR